MRFSELTVEEVNDLWQSARTIGNAIEKVRSGAAFFFYPMKILIHTFSRNNDQHWNASALTYTVQDGAMAGQTIEHVHVHVMPRKKGDFKNNDDIYTAIEDDDRVARTLKEMTGKQLPVSCRIRTLNPTQSKFADEADVLRALFDEEEQFKLAVEEEEEAAEKH